MATEVDAEPPSSAGVLVAGYLPRRRREHRDEVGRRTPRNNPDRRPRPEVSQLGCASDYIELGSEYIRATCEISPSSSGGKRTGDTKPGFASTASSPGRPAT